jgi:gamma-D-glutamyl-L-lysine dipeptidyl-peptidase
MSNDALPVMDRGAHHPSGSSGASPWALVNRSVADLMARPSVSAERVSQGLLGDACRVLDQQGDWAQVRLERDGYVGWLQLAALHLAPEHELGAFTAAAQTLVIGEIAQAYLDSAGTEVAGKLHLGLCLPLAHPGARLLAVRLPDERVWWLAASDAISVAERPALDANGVARTLAMMRRSIGVPYLWGGCTPFGYDCSGLSQAFYALFGVRIPRDADQQFQAGLEVQGTPAPGDLIFFRVEGGDTEAARHSDVRHVAISLGGNQILHASGRARCVAIDSLAGDGDSYGSWLSKRIAGVRRFSTCT